MHFLHGNLHLLALDTKGRGISCFLLCARVCFPYFLPASHCTITWTWRFNFCWSSMHGHCCLLYSVKLQYWLCPPPSPFFFGFSFSFSFSLNFWSQCICYPIPNRSSIVGASDAFDTWKRTSACFAWSNTHIKMPFLRGLSSCGGWGHTDDGFVDNLLVLGKWCF
jgi:hypothetical protein